MKKLVLDAESLQVESFDISSRETALRGTVQGASATLYGEPTCDPHCGDGGDYTYVGSCGSNCTVNVTCPSRRPGEYTCQTM